MNWYRTKRPALGSDSSWSTLGSSSSSSGEEEEEKEMRGGEDKGREKGMVRREEEKLVWRKKRLEGRKGR